MKKYFTILFILLLFIGFVIVDYSRKNEYKVLEIVNPDTIVADLNRNGVKDLNETVCISDIRSYKFNIDDTKTVGLWYLANQYAEKILKDKNIKIKFTGKKDLGCRYAGVNVDNQDYGALLDRNNFNLNNIDNVKLNEQKNKVKKLNLVIYNHHSNKYHILTCKYGKIAHDIAILPFKQLPKDAKPCKFCHIKKGEHHKFKKFEEKTFPLMIEDKNIILILSDLTTTLKPDRYCNHLMCRELVSQIDSAKKSIDIASYGFDNIPKLDKAIQAAQKRGVKIRVVYDVNKTGKPDYYKETDKFLSFIPKENCNNDFNYGNSSSSIIMHNKFLVIDKQTVYTGSMNFSTTGLSGFNSNSVVVINSPKLAQIYEDEFEQMYSGKFHNDKKRGFYHTAGNISAYFSPQDKVITSEIIPLINRAKNKIYMPIFILTHDELTKALINAHKRGVDVKIIIDATNVKAKRSKVKILRASGISVKVENYAGKMHAKTIIIDDRYLITGSMNFTKSGENKNDENCLIIDDVRLAKFYSEFFDYIWKKIPKAYLTHSVAAEGLYSKGSCEDGIDNDFDGKIDKADEACAPDNTKSSQNVNLKHN